MKTKGYANICPSKEHRTSKSNLSFCTRMYCEPWSNLICFLENRAIYLF